MLSVKTVLKKARTFKSYDILGEIDEGTFGRVYRANERCSDNWVAIKNVKMSSNNGLYGYPISSIREMNIMLNLRHPNIVTVYEIIVGFGMIEVFIVLELMDHDLKSLMENMSERYFTISSIKNIAQQIILGVMFLHDNWILHRDIKTSNILYNNKGEVKLCDFGLAREYSIHPEKYTGTVITPNYRPPELFLGIEIYSSEIDIWSCGCVFAELFKKEPLFSGRRDSEIVYKIFSVLGTPSESRWPYWTKLPHFKAFNYPLQTKCQLRSIFSGQFFDSRPILSKLGLDFLKNMLCVCPKNRGSAKGVLHHSWLREIPLPRPNYMMPTFPSTSGLGRKKRYQVRRADPLERIALNRKRFMLNSRKRKL